ncbi:probable disease resistance RPP8-like protein 2 [Vitis riparia]|uniref:probable disease resistance RPP8-like protein 2 n=1 Tax=Vitis riparia TaxID=96939 RepID=UPI00155A9441|nr:probable disease resistance RPP8-like protein 2 [Vitis riparia]
MFHEFVDPMIISKEMGDLGKKMAKRCDGLPLAIVVLGGVLATKPTFSEWKMVDTNIRSYLSRGDDHSKKQCSGVSRVLDLSYQDLPYHLKLCFIYLAHFPEDHEIPVNTLVQMWMAEGIIAGLPDNEETLEDVGQWYLGELVGRCMVQVGATSSNGMVKTCRLHDLMRDLGLSKARENFFETFHWQVETNPSSTSKKVRRGVIYLDPGAKTSSPMQVPDNARNLRSLLTFCYAPNAVHMMPRKLDLKDFKLLRVLHLERLLLDEKLVRAIRYLIHLRYLSFKNARLSCIRSSIGNLGSMQTLDLRFDNHVTGFKIHDVLSRMKWLRHLYLPRFITTDDKVLWDSLSNLETLKNFDAERWAVRDLATLTKLRKLKMMNVKSFQELEVILKDCNGLHSLSFDEAIQTTIEETDLKQLSTCRHLYKLKLPGQISSLPGHQHLPQSLTKLVLRTSRLAQDPMPILERLPNLTVLHLLVNAYVGEEMVFSTDGFPKLKNLILGFIHNLKKLRVEEGAMPSLKGLKIASCSNLEMIPEGLRYITTLDVLEIKYMPEFEERLKVINGNEGEDFYKVKHVPSISFFP